VKDRFGSVDILINNAGINRPSPCLDISEAEWQDHFDTNVKGGFLVAQKLAPAMISKSWGRVIWISSQSGLIGIPGQPAYCSTKGAVVQLVRALGLERFRFGMTVNSVAPTVVETDLTRRRFQDLEFLSSCSRRFPAGKLPRGGRRNSSRALSHRRTGRYGELPHSCGRRWRDSLVNGGIRMAMHSLTDGVGTAAAIIGTITFIPQVIKVWKQGGRDLSYLMLLFYGSAVVLWAIYGVLRHDIPLVVANLLIGLLVGLTAWLKWAFERGAQRLDPR
jgi:uncharacterized protein with PQ loop repeat